MDWSIITSNEDLIILNIVLFFLFALVGSLDFKKKENRGEAEAATASVSVIVAESFGLSQRFLSLGTFITEFYVMMHGLAVSAYAFLWLFGQDPSGWVQANALFEILGLVLFLLGGLLVFFGWDRIFNSRKNGQLVTNGLYGRIRHPQYLGILIATLGMIVYKFSPISLLLWPVLLIIYYRLARKEENSMESKFGEQYSVYKRKVHMFLPFGLSSNSEKL
jgi:protein-S-isoprenylcysteine O-methyltransferase Ste14